MILEFDGQKVKAMHDLPRLVADEPIGKEVPVVDPPQGQQQTVTVTLGRLEDAEEVAAVDENAPEAETDQAPRRRPVIAGPLGLTLADLSPTLRSRVRHRGRGQGRRRHRGRRGSAAAEKRVAGRRRHRRDFAGAGRDARPTSRAGSPQLKSDGRKSALFLLANKDGDLRFVAVTLQ